MIELAIAVLILGILVSMGAGMIGPLTARMKASETKENLSAAVDSVVGSATANGRIPDAAQFQGMIRSVDDPWGKRVQYVFDSNLTVTAAAICSSATANITVTNGANVYRNVAFVVLSGGANYNNQTAGGGPGPAAITVYDSGTANVDGYAGDFNRPEEYDDIVKWMTLSELQGKIGCGSMAYEVWNPGILAYFKVNGVGGCMPVPANNPISSLSQNATINGFSDPGCSVSTIPPSIAFSEAAAIDANSNRRINYDKTDR